MNISSTPYENPLYTEVMKIGDFEIRPLDLLEHVLATGGTGSGKTRSFLLPCVERVLERFGNDPEEKAAMLLIDAKGDMAELAGECIRRSGRKDTVYILGAGGNCWFSFLEQFKGDPTAVANFLFETLEDRTGDGSCDNESFWEENARRLLRAGVICAKASHGPELGGLLGIRDGVNLVLAIKDKNDSDEGDSSESESGLSAFNKVISNGLRDGRITGHERDDVKDYVQRDVIPGYSNTWGTIANMTRNYIAQFSQPALQELFQQSEGKRKIIPEELIDEGLLLIISLSPVIYREAATPFRIAVKKTFFERILQRNHLVTGRRGEEREINQIRPILCVMDEFHTTLSPKGRSSDAYFLDRAREFRCMCILATQGISAIASIIKSDGMRNHLLNNCRTKFFFGNDCPQTSEYFESLGGSVHRIVKSLRFERVEAPPRFRLPNHEFVDSPRTSFTGYTLESRREPRFSGAEVGSLPNGSALVVKKGRELIRFTLDPKAYATGIRQEAASDNTEI